MIVTKPFELTMLSSPGLKKSTRAMIFPELGEDAAGCKIVANHIIAWVADGAPGPIIQENALEGETLTLEELSSMGPQFGSRTLARLLGEAFVATIENLLPHQHSSRDFDEKAISKALMRETRQLIARRLLQFVPLLSKMDLPTDASGRLMLEWSASFLGVVLNLETLEGMAYSSGDCLGLILTETDRLIVGGNLMGRFFCRWKCTPDELKEELFHVKLIKGKTFLDHFKDTRQVALMSDGVAAKKELMNVTSVKDIDVHCRSTEDDRTIITIIFPR